MWGIANNKDCVLEDNIKKMMSWEKGGMLESLARESIGGNAGYEKIGKKEYSCAAVNLAYSAETGEIVKFSNYLSDFIGDSRFGLAYFRVAVDLERMRGKKFRNPFFKIIKMIFESKTTPDAKKNLEKSVDEYNRLNKK